MMASLVQVSDTRNGYLARDSTRPADVLASDSPPDAAVDHRLNVLVINENVVRRSAACRTPSWLKSIIACLITTTAVSEVQLADGSCGLTAWWEFISGPETYEWSCPLCPSEEVTTRNAFVTFPSDHPHLTGSLRAWKGGRRSVLLRTNEQRTSASRPTYGVDVSISPP